MTRGVAVSPSKPSQTKRPKGEGAVFQRCDLDRGCPPMEFVTDATGKRKRVRPKHHCKGMWIARLDLGPDMNGKPNRPQRASATYAGALAKLQELRDQYTLHGDVPTRSPTVQAWLTKWLAEIVLPNLSPGTYRTYRSAVTEHLIKSLGKKRLERLKPGDLRKLYAHMLATGSTGMRPSVHRTLRAALSSAMREGLVMRNVAKLVPEPSGKNEKRGALTAAEGRDLLRHVVEDRLSSRWVMALLTAVRQGECLGLTWDRVDLDARVMDVAWQLKRITFVHGCGDQREDGTWPCGRTHGGRCQMAETQADGTVKFIPARKLRVPDGFDYTQLNGGLCLVRPKSEASKRVLPIPAPLYASLLAHKEGDDSPNPHNLVWHELDGKPIEPADDTQAWNDHLAAAGLPDVVLHEARHTTITLLMEAGVDPTVIQAIAGHSSLVVQETYKHADVRHMAEALGKVAGALYLEEAKESEPTSAVEGTVVEDG